MNRPAYARAGWKLAGTFAAGALWGAAAAAVESLLVNHALAVGIQKTASLAELVVNYAVYAGAGAVVLRLAVGAIQSRRGTRADMGDTGRNAARSADGRLDPASLSEAIVGAGLFVGVFATYVQKGVLGNPPLTWPLAVGIGVTSVVAMVVLVRVLGRLKTKSKRVLRTALAGCVAVGFLWTPLFGPYSGILVGHRARAEAKGAKNVLLIIVDTLRADYLDCYGGQLGVSPVLNRLADGGVLYDNNVAQSTWTLPTTTSILTGLFPSTHGAVATGMSLASATPTLSEVLQKAGYRTGAFTENAYIRPQYGFGRGFDHFWTYWLPWVFDGTALYRVTGRLGLPKIQFTNKHAYITIPRITSPEGVNWDARVVTDRALEWLKKDTDAPFFAYLHYMGPHGPYGPREYLLDGDPPSKRLADYPRPMGGAYPLGGPAGVATDEELAVMKQLYAADIKCVDHHVGRLVRWLEETGKLSETVVVVTADHGEEFLDHGSWNHGSSAFSEVARVPFIVHAEGAVPAGVRVPTLTRQIDLVPTVLDLVGLECPRDIQGRSVLPLALGGSLDPVPAYVEVYPAVPAEADIFALVNARYKVVRVSLEDRSAVLLYDLETDPGERKNLADVAPALRDSLLVEMDKWDQMARVRSPIDPKRLKYFRSLGYINQ